MKQINEKKELIDIYDEVNLKDTNSKGIVTFKDNNKITVSINGKKVTTTFENVVLINKYSNNLKNNNYTANITTSNYSYNFNNELMIRYLTKDEAIYNVEIFLKEAFSLGVFEVKIIHGKQGGVLREAVKEYLTRCKYVESFRLAGYYDGQYGVTIAKIKSN